MLSNNITALEIFAAFKKEHIQMPGGFLTSDSTEFLINLDLESETFNNLNLSICTGVKIVISNNHKVNKIFFMSINYIVEVCMLQ